MVLPMKRKKTFIINPEDEEKGFLLWLHLINGCYRELFFANLIAIVSLLPAVYVGYLFTQTRHPLLGLLFALLTGVAGPAMTLLSGIACRISLRKPVWLKEDVLLILKQDLVSSVILGFLAGILWAVIYFAAYMVYAVEGGFSLMVLLLILLYGYLAAGFTIFSFQQLAMLEIPLSRVLLNGVLLIFAGKGRSFAAILLPIVTLALCRYFYGVGGLLLIAGLPALALMTSDFVFVPVFSRLFLDGEETE